MKRFLTLALTFAMCLTLVSCSGTTTSESPASTGTASAAEADDTVYELKLAHIYAADHPFNVGLNQIAQEISDQTDGHVNITVYPAAQLGAETDEINNILSGLMCMKPPMSSAAAIRQCAQSTATSWHLTMNR